jgi:hypothetical protein
VSRMCDTFVEHGASHMRRTFGKHASLRCRTFGKMCRICLYKCHIHVFHICHTCVAHVSHPDFKDLSKLKCKCPFPFFNHRHPKLPKANNFKKFPSFLNYLHKLFKTPRGSIKTLHENELISSKGKN